MHAIKGASLRSSWTPIHAASVARQGSAVLIVGQSGAGKTSIAMTCAAQGWDYLGDDAVIVRAGPPRVASLYSSARLREDTFQRYPEAMRACLGISDDAGELKAEVDMALLRPPAAVAEIRAIVVPQPTDWSAFKLTPMGRADTLRKLMEATRQSMMGDEAVAFSKLAALVSQVPCYALKASGDAAALSEGLARLTAAEAVS
jgi:KaiC/GvpD/RAD55 family RecA-like ATPase